MQNLVELRKRQIAELDAELAALARMRDASKELGKSIAENVNHFHIMNQGQIGSALC